MRRISKNGSSLVVVIPPEFIAALNVLPGDDLELTLDADRRGYSARPARRRVVETPLPAAVRADHA